MNHINSEFQAPCKNMAWKTDELRRPVEWDVPGQCWRRCCILQPLESTRQAPSLKGWLCGSVIRYPPLRLLSPHGAGSSPLLFPWTENSVPHLNSVFFQAPSGLMVGEGVMHRIQQEYEGLLTWIGLHWHDPQVVPRRARRPCANCRLSVLGLFSQHTQEAPGCKRGWGRMAVLGLRLLTLSSLAFSSRFPHRPHLSQVHLLIRDQCPKHPRELIFWK